MRLTKRGCRVRLGCAGVFVLLAAVGASRVTASDGAGTGCGAEAAAPAAPDASSTACAELRKNLEQVQCAAEQALKEYERRNCTPKQDAGSGAICKDECGIDVRGPDVRAVLVEVDGPTWWACATCLQRWTDDEVEKWESKRPTESDKAARDKFDDEARRTARAISDADHALRHAARQPLDRQRRDAEQDCYDSKGLCDSLKRKRRRLHESVRRLLSDVGLWQPISAELVTGLLTGAVSSQNVPAGTGGTLPQGYLQFSSRRATLDESLDGERRLDVNLGGRFGFVPALSLLPPTAPASSTSDASASATDSKPVGKLQEAFIWETSAMMNVRVSLFELSLVAAGGQINADDQSSIQGSGKDALLVVPLSGNSEFRWHWAAGIRTRVYAANQTPAYVQELNGLVAPALEASVFYKREPRFSEQKGMIVPEAGWPRRLALRLMLNSIPVIKSGSVPGTPAEFTISLGVEYEGRWPWNHDRQNLPAVTRLLVYGNLDLFRVLRGS